MLPRVYRRYVLEEKAARAFICWRVAKREGSALLMQLAQVRILPRQPFLEGRSGMTPERLEEIKDEVDRFCRDDIASFDIDIVKELLAEIDRLSKGNEKLRQVINLLITNTRTIVQDDEAAEMSKSYADECLERAEKATPGPWSWDTVFQYDQTLRIMKGIRDDVFISADGPVKADAEFIAHARTDVVELANRLKKACDAMRNCTDDMILLNLARELEAPFESEEK